MHINQVNKNYGFRSFVLGLGCTTVGVLKDCVNEESKLNKVLGFGEKILEGTRFNQQYSIYGRKDDDLGYDTEHRPHAANIGEIACNIEQKLNPFLLPVSECFDENLRQAIEEISHYPTSLWWRARLFSTKIDWNSVCELPEHFKDLCNGDLVDKNIAVGKIDDTVSSILGMIGFAAMGIFQPIKSWNKFKGIENRIIDGLANIGLATQNVAYFFRFTVPQLLNKNKEMFVLGAAGNVMNAGLPVIDILQNNKKVTAIYKKLTQGLTMAFFSRRRKLMGESDLNAAG